MQSRWRSKTAWTALFTLILFALKHYAKIEITGADELLNLIMLVATGFGIFNDPTNKEGF